MSDPDAENREDAEDAAGSGAWTPGRVLLVGGLLSLAAGVMVAAWVSDDALITLRSVDHLLHGRGLRYNPVDRVQSFTHPLWLFFVTPFVAVTGEGLWAPIAASLLCTVAAVAIAVRVCGVATAGAWACVLALAASKSFVDYATSGLENPLTNLLLAAFALLWLEGKRPGARAPRQVCALTFVTALLFTNRMDAVLLVVPAALWLGLGELRAGRLARVAPAVVLGSAPALAWLAFAWLYYGSPLPNTAFAKLSTGVERGALVAQGLAYLRALLDLDAAGALVLLAGGVAGLSSRRAALRSLALGVPLYVAYVVWIGGDFMAGRFFAAPIFLSALVLGRSAREAAPEWQARFAPAISMAAVVLAAFTPGSPLRSSTADTYALRDPAGRLPGDGIVDERLWYYTRTGAFSAHRETGLAPSVACQGEPQVRVRRVCGGLGRVGFEGCAGDHWIDPCGLNDAFLARRAVAGDQVWRIGHFPRALPERYAASVAEGRPLMNDPDLDRAFTQTMLRVRTPIFDAERLTTILRHPIDWNAD